MDDESTPTLAEFWEARYAGTGQVWSGRANQAVVDVVSALPAGKALDLGCGAWAHGARPATRARTTW